MRIKNLREKLSEFYSTTKMGIRNLAVGLTLTGLTLIVLNHPAYASETKSEYSDADFNSVPGDINPDLVLHDNYMLFEARVPNPNYRPPKDKYEYMGIKFNNSNIPITDCVGGIDWNFDGQKDVVSVNSRGEVSVYFNNGANNDKSSLPFQEEELIRTVPVGKGNCGLKIGDYLGKGKPLLLVKDGNGDVHEWYPLLDIQTRDKETKGTSVNNK